jgi:hypothetical protein
MNQNQQFLLVADECAVKDEVVQEGENRKFRFAWISNGSSEHAFGRVFARSFFEAFRKTVEANDILRRRSIAGMRFVGEDEEVLSISLQNSVELQLREVPR